MRWRGCPVVRAGPGRHPGVCGGCCSDEHRVGALGADGLGPVFGEGVHSRGLWCGFLDLDVFCGEDGVEGVGEDGLSVPDQVPELVGPFAGVGQEVAGRLCRRGRGGVLGDADDVHAPGSEFEDEGHVQAFERDGVDLEEVGGQDRCGLGVQERAPGWAVVPLRDGRGPVAAQDLADGGGGDPVAQAPQGRPGCGCSPTRDCRGLAGGSARGVRRRSAGVPEVEAGATFWRQLAGAGAAPCPG